MLNKSMADERNRVDVGSKIQRTLLKIGTRNIIYRAKIESSKNKKKIESIQVLYMGQIYNKKTFKG